MYNYLWVVYQSEEPVLESGAADIGAVVATIDAVTLKWDELNWKLFPRLRLHGKRGDFDYSYMKRGCHYQGCELPLRFHADGRVGHFSARAPEDAQFDGRWAVHACAAQPRDAVMACALAKHLLQSTSVGWTQERLKAWAEKADRRFEKKIRLQDATAKVQEALAFEWPEGLESLYAQLSTASEDGDGVEGALASAEEGRDEGQRGQAEVERDRRNEDAGGIGGIGEDEDDTEDNGSGAVDDDDLLYGADGDADSVDDDDWASADESAY